MSRPEAADRVRHPRRQRNPDGRMPLREHLREARRRLGWIALGLLIGAVVGWIVYPHVFAALADPVTQAGAERGGTVVLNFPSVMSSLDMQIKVSVFVGVLLTSPWWIYQLWSYVTPGLTRRERRYTLAFVAAGTPLFLAGAFLAWWVMPRAVGVLTGFTPEGGVNVMDAQLYLGFVMRLILVFGLGFLLPVLMVGLNRAGIVSGQTWLRGWRWAVLIAFTFGAMASPAPDVLSMFALAIPVSGLYFAAVGWCLLHDRRKARRSAAAGQGEGAA